MKQTAAQWLFLMLNNPNKDQEFANKLLEKAIEMEKEQIVNSWDDGFSNGFDLGKYDDDCKHDDGQQYYNQTYEAQND